MSHVTYDVTYEWVMSHMNAPFICDIHMIILSTVSSICVKLNWVVLVPYSEIHCVEPNGVVVWFGNPIHCVKLNGEVTSVWHSEFHYTEQKLLNWVSHRVSLSTGSSELPAESQVATQFIIKEISWGKFLRSTETATNSACSKYICIINWVAHCLSRVSSWLNSSYINWIKKMILDLHGDCNKQRCGSHVCFIWMSHVTCE